MGIAFEKGEAMNYVLSDIHNDYKKFCEMLHVIHFSETDRLYVLGDLFDRCDYDPNPVDLYFKILSLGSRCAIIRGNHDEWLASYILNYYKLPEWRRKKEKPYAYNTFRCLTRRMPPIDIQKLAENILNWPLQIKIQVKNENYLLAHAMTSIPEISRDKNYYLMGYAMSEAYLKNGVDHFISVCGHRNTENHRIWRNERENLIMCDCGCGYRSGKLGCLCLETKEEFYVD